MNNVFSRGLSKGLTGPLRMPEGAPLWRTETNDVLGKVLLGTLDLSVREDQWKLIVSCTDTDWYGLTEAGSLVAFPGLTYSQWVKLISTGKLTIEDVGDGVRAELSLSKANG